MAQTQDWYNTLGWNLGGDGAQAWQWKTHPNVTIDNLIGRIKKTGGVDGDLDTQVKSISRINPEEGYGWGIRLVSALTPGAYHQIFFDTDTADVPSFPILYSITFPYAGGIEFRENTTLQFTGAYTAGQNVDLISDLETFSLWVNGAKVFETPFLPTFPFYGWFVGRESNSEFSSVTFNNVLAIPLAPPRRTRAVVSGAGALVTGQRLDNDATGYEVSRRRGEPGAWGVIGTATATGGAGSTISFVDSSILDLNVPYAYRFRPFKAGGVFGNYSTAAHATRPPAVPGSIKTDFGIYPKPALPVKPIAGGYFFDEVFGTKIMRVTDETLDPGGTSTAYSYWHTLSKDNTLLFVQRGNEALHYEFDPVNFALGRRLGKPPFYPNAGSSELRYEDALWSHIYNDKMIVHRNANEQTFYYFDVVTREFTLLADFAADFPGQYFVQVLGSDDDDVLSFTLRSEADFTVTGIACVRLSTGEVLYQEAPAGGVTFDECQVDKSGRYLYIIYDPQSAGAACVDLLTGVKTTVAENATENALGHHDAGTGFFVGVAHFIDKVIKVPGSAPRTHSLVVDYVNPARSPGVGEGAEHYSMLANNEAFLLTSTYGASVPQSQLREEVFLVSLDGLQTYRRLFHHRSKWNPATPEYTDSPRANISRDGRFVSFSSNWETSNVRKDLFVASIVPATTDPTPPEVLITSPLHGQTVSGTILLLAAASDNVGVEGVQFMIGNSLLGAEITIAPYQLSFNTATKANGSYQLSATARDAAGNTATATITIIINNVDNDANNNNLARRETSRSLEMSFDSRPLESPTLQLLETLEKLKRK